MKYIVEWASDEWGEYKTDAWQEKEFSDTKDAEEYAISKAFEGYAVRLYIKEV